MATLARLMLRPDYVIYLANLAIVVTLTCGMGLLAARLCRRGSTPLRHGILAAVLALILLSPGSVWVGQRRGLGLIPVAVSRGETAGQADASPGPAHPLTLSLDAGAFPAERTGEGRGPASGALLASAGADSPRPLALEGPAVETAPAEPFAGMDGPSVPPASSGDRRSLWWQVLGTFAAGAWAAGVLAGVLRLAWGYVLLMRIRASLRRPDPCVARLGRRVADGMGLRHTPGVYISPWVPVPLSLGLARLAIVLPAALTARMEEAQLEAILVHEMAHLVRRDPWVGLAQRIAVVLFWWNPLVRRVSDQISTLREDLCDNYVVRAQGSGEPFARTLLDVASQVTVHPRLPATVGVLEPNLDGLTERVHRLIGKERDMATRMSIGSTVVVLTCGLVLLLGTGLVRCLQAAEVRNGPAAAQTPQESLKPPSVPATAEAPATAGSDTIIDPNTGIKFLLAKTISGANDVIRFTNKLILSPDARFLVSGDLVVPLDGTRAFRFTEHSGDVRDRAVSPDGRYIIHGEKTVWLQPVSRETLRPDGPAKKLVDLAGGRLVARNNGKSLHWTRDSKAVFFAAYDAEGGVHQYAFSAATGAPVNYPDAESAGLLSPDGKCVALTLTDPAGGFWVKPIGDGAARALGERPRGEPRPPMCWSKDGHWLIGDQVDRVLRFVRYPEGQEYRVSLPKDLMPPQGDYSGTACVGPSADGSRLFFYQTRYEVKWRIKVASAEGAALRDLDSDVLYAFRAFQWARDGKATFQTYYRVDEETGLLMSPLSGDKPVQCTLRPAVSAGAMPLAVSPDSQWLLFTPPQESGSSKWDLNVIPLSLADHGVSGPATVLLRITPPARAGSLAPVWSPDSTRLALTCKADPAAEQDVWVVFIDGRTPIRLTRTAVIERDLKWSPDGNMLAFVSEDGGAVELKVIPTAGGEAVLIRKWVDVAPPAWGWSPDGKSLAIVEEGMLVRQPVSGGRAELIANLKELRIEVTEWLGWSPDGSRLALAYGERNTEDSLASSRHLLFARVEGGHLQETAVADLRGWTGFHAWSPDSTHVAYLCEDTVPVRPASRLYEVAVDDVVERIEAGAIPPTPSRAAEPAAAGTPSESTPAPQPEPIAGTVFSDDFDNGLSKYWQIAPWFPDASPPPAHAVENGHLMLSNSSVRLSHIDWADYRVTVRVCVKERRAIASIQTRATPGSFRADSMDRYSLGFGEANNAPRSALRLGLQYHDASGAPRSARLGANPRTMAPDTWYKLAFEVRGEHLRGYLDDELVIEATDGRLSKGAVWITATGSPVLFDDFSVRRLP